MTDLKKAASSGEAFGSGTDNGESETLHWAITIKLGMAWAVIAWRHTLGRMRGPEQWQERAPLSGVVPLR